MIRGNKAVKNVSTINTPASASGKCSIGRGAKKYRELVSRKRRPTCSHRANRIRITYNNKFKNAYKYRI